MKKEIDLLKIKKQAINHPLLTFMKGPNIIPYEVALASSFTSYMIAPNNIQLILSSLVAIEFSYLLYKKYQSYQKNNNNVAGSNDIYCQILKTEEYATCENLYNEYIKNIASFLHTFHFESSKELLIFLEYLLNGGQFSHTFSHEYHDYKTYYEYMNKLLGARVCTGKSVCRHMSSFFSDILTAYGTTASFVVVKITNQKDIFHAANELKSPFPHAVVGIKDKDKKYLFDPTEGVFAGLTDETNDEALNRLIGIMTPSTLNNYYLISNEQLVFDDSSLSRINSVITLPFSKITEEEIAYFLKVAEEKIRINASMINEFYHSNYTLTKDINELVNKINPASDSEITSWTLTKKNKTKK